MHETQNQGNAAANAPAEGNSIERSQSQQGAAHLRPLSATSAVRPQARRVILVVIVVVVVGLLVALGWKFFRLKPYDSYVRALAWSPNGQLVASKTTDGSIRLWDRQGKSVAVFRRHYFRYDEDMSAWSPDGMTLATSQGNEVQIWEARSRTITAFNAHTNSVTVLTWSPDGKTLATTDGPSVRLWSTRGAPIATLNIGSPVNGKSSVASLAWSPDGRTLAAAYSSPVDARGSFVQLWGAQGAPIATLDYTGDARKLAWSPDGSMLALVSYDLTVRLWNAQGSTMSTLQHGEYIAWSPDSKTLAIASLVEVRLWSAEGGPIVDLSEANGVRALAWSPDGRTLATGEDSTVRLWDAQGAPIATLNGHAAVIWALDWSPDGAALASGSMDGIVRLWDAQGAPIATLNTRILIATLLGDEQGVTTLAWSPDGKIIAVGANTSVQLWNADGGHISTLKP